MKEVTIAAKLTEEELRRIDDVVRRRGLLNRSDLIREAIGLYLGLTSLEAEARLRMLRLINESAGSSGKTSGELIDEVRGEREL